MSFNRVSLGTLVMLALFAPLLLGASGLREDEFECEQAASHLKSCCPSSFDPTHVGCAYDEGGCGSPATYPSLGIDDSKCIEEKSCDEILASGLCDRVANRGSYQTFDASISPPRVCE